MGAPNFIQASGQALGTAGGDYLVLLLLVTSALVLAVRFLGRKHGR